MINEQTVLILGAGSSIDYGFPSGPKLMSEIVYLFESNIRRKRAINVLFKLRNFNNYNIYYSAHEGERVRRAGNNSISDDFHEIDELITAIKYSGAASIDDLLHHRDDLVDIGKLAIALSISNYEIKENFLAAASKDKNFEDSHNWYAYLWKSLYSIGRNKAQVNLLNNNKIDIITFNYDRSLEFFLYNAIKALYGANPQLVADIINNINIRHVYGSVGMLPWQNIGKEINDYEPIILNNLSGIVSQLNTSNSKSIKVGTAIGISFDEFWQKVNFYIFRCIFWL